MNNTTSLNVKGKKVTLTQTTEYPWKGDISLKIEKGNQHFNMRIRIPGWVRNQVVPSDLYRYVDKKQLNYVITVNGEKQESEIKNGFFDINRNWKKGDVIHIHFDMKPRLVKAIDKVCSDKGRVSVECGPLVYCAEWPDNTNDVRSCLLQKSPNLELVYKPDLLGGINVISTTSAQSLKYESDGTLSVKPMKLTLIPYYAWDHRGAKGSMTVWLADDVSAVQPECSK